MTNTTLHDLIEANWDPQQVPGFTVGLCARGEVACYSFGVTNIEQPLPVTADTLFQVGSISKTYTTLALLQFVERGVLALEGLVQSYLPNFRVADEQTSREVTIRQLLTHAPGWEGDFFVDTGEGDDALNRYVTEMAELEQIVPAGQVFSYNNSGFNVAGRLLEVASGLCYETAVQTHLLEPLGLGHTYFTPAEVMTYRFAVGHHEGETGPVVARPWALPRAGNPVGGVVTSILDLMRYAQFYLDDGRTPSGQRLLTPSMQAAMQSPQQPIWGENEAVGFSWFIDDSRGPRILYHMGATNGQVAGLFLIPEKQFAVAVLTNSSQPGELIHQVTDWALASMAQVVPAEETPQTIPAELAPYLGKYVRSFAELELKPVQDQLQAQIHYLGGFPTKEDPPPPDPPLLKLALVEADRFEVLDGPSKSTHIDIIRKEDGTIGWARAMRRLYPRKF